MRRLFVQTGARAIVVVPIASLSWMAFAYVQRCLSYLQDPKQAIEIQLPSPGGIIRARAERYVINVAGGYIRMSGVSLIDPKGALLARADELSLTGLRPSAGANQVVRLHGRGLFGQVERLPNGRLAIEDLLPPSTPEPSTTPFQVDLEDVRLQVIDRTGRSPWRRELSTATVHASGIGFDWQVIAPIQVANSGLVALAVHHDAKQNLRIDLQTSGVEVAEPLGHFLPKLKASAEQLRVAGRGRIWLRKNRPTIFEARLRAEGTNLAYQTYRSQSATFDGYVTPDGLRGRISAESPGLQAKFDGNIAFEAPSATGRLVATAATSSALPITLPKGVSFKNLAYDGWLSANKEIHLSGQARADLIRYDQYLVFQPTTQIDTDGRTVRLEVRDARYQGNRLTATGQVDLKTKTITASLHGDSVALGPLAGYRGLVAQVPVWATVQGPWTKPAIDVRTTGPAQVTLPGGQTLRFADTQLGGEYAQGRIRVDRAIARGDDGLLQASGILRPTGATTLNVVARGVPLRLLSPDVRGTANLEATVTGTVQRPRAVGRVEAYETSVSGHTIPALQSAFVADRTRLALNDIRGFRGAATAQGRASLRFRDGAIAGQLSASGLELADWVDAGTAAGSVDVRDVVVRGTLAKPEITASLVAPRLIVGGVKVLDAYAQLAQNGSDIRLFDARATTARGHASASASYNLQQQTGQFQAAIKGLEIGDAAPEVGNALTLDGQTDLVVAGTFTDNQLVTAEATATVRQIVINDTMIGDGKLAAQFSQGHLKGNLQIGQLDNYLEFTNVDYDFGTRRIAGELSAYQIPVHDVIQLGLRYLPTDAFDARDALTQVRGVFNLGGKVEGTMADLGVEISSLNLANLTYRARPIGELTSTFARKEGTWTLGDSTFTGPVGTLTASGTYQEKGDLNLSGDLSGLNLAELSLIDPRLPAITGKVDVSFLASGQANQPEIQATVNGTGLLRVAGDNDDRGLRVALDTVHIGPGIAEASGNYFFRGFQGTVEAKAPFQYPGKIPEDGAISGRLTVAERSLKEIAQLVDGLDATRTEGAVRGELSVRGTAGKPELGGSLVVTAPKLASPGVTDTINDFLGTVTLANRQLKVDLKGTSSRGGTFAANAQMPVALSSETASRTLLASPLTGALSLTDLKLRQDFKGRAYVEGRLNSQIALAGTLAAPKLSGPIRLAGLDSVLPAFESRTTEARESAVNPNFDLTLSLDSPAHVRSATADFLLDGRGSLRGSLAEPNLVGALSVNKGSIRLPGSLVRIDQGGTLSLNYVADVRAPQLNFGVNLLGRTRVVTANGGTNIERYDIELAVQGDLLQESGLTFTAASDPPGLSQDQILGLLGRTDLLASVTNSGGQKTQNQIRDALAGFALPVVFDPITQGIARSLSLDYLSLEYNGIDQASVALARTLSREFTLQGSRQLSEPAPGFPARFDFRLTYKPRRTKGILSRLSYSIGADQDTRWRLSADYGVRY